MVGYRRYKEGVLTEARPVIRTNTVLKIVIQGKELLPKSRFYSVFCVVPLLLSS